MIKVKVIEADGMRDPLAYTMKVAIKNDKNMEILDSQFEFSNLPSKHIIYNHSQEESLMVCFSSDVEVYSVVKIDVVLEMQELSAESDDFYKLENSVSKAKKMYAEFNAQANEFEGLEQEANDENIKLNSKIIRTTFLEMILMLLFGFLQYGVLRFAINRVKKE